MTHFWHHGAPLMIAKGREGRESEMHVGGGDHAAGDEDSLEVAKMFF